MKHSLAQVLGRVLVAIFASVTITLLILAFVGEGVFYQATVVVFSPFFNYALFISLFLVVLGLAIVNWNKQPRLVALSVAVAVAGITLIYLAYIIGAFSAVDCNIHLSGFSGCLRLAGNDPIATILGCFLAAGGIFGVAWPYGENKPTVVPIVAGLITITLSLIPSFSYNYIDQPLDYLLIGFFLVPIWVFSYRLTKNCHGTKGFWISAIVSALMLVVVFAPILPFTISYAGVDYPNCGVSGQPACPSGGFPVDTSISFALSDTGEVYVPVGQTFMTSGWYWSPHLQI